MGIRSRKSFDKMTTSGKLFITRSELHIKCSDVNDNKISEKPLGSTVTLNSDHTATLSSRQSKKTENRYRVIKGTIDVSGKPICFVTNMLDEDAYTIAKLYKQRWEIETFFKFIKQHLNAKHLVSRNSNGIKVMIYMTMILATLIIAYRKLNFMKGFKIPKLKFELELDNEIIKEIVRLCGGDPSKAPHLFHSQ